MNTLIAALIIIGLLSQLGMVYLLYKEKRKKENEFYTDYKNGGLTMRVYKHEFGFQAFKDVERNDILESGNLSLNYGWLLFENKRSKNG